jgi:predicted Zn-dependent peptidase
MVVGVAGAVGDDLLPRLEELLGDVSGNGTGAPAAADQVRSSEPRVRIHRKDSDQAQIALGVPSYPLGHPDRYALGLLAAVLGSGMSSRLFLEVRERRGLAYYIYGMNHSYTDAGSLFAQGGVDLARVDEAVTVVAEQFRRLAEEPIPADELEKARALTKGRFVLQTESPNGLLLFGLRREVLEGAALEPEEYLAAIDAVTGEDVQRVAQDILGSAGLNLALIGPFDDAERFEKLLA